MGAEELGRRGEGGISLRPGRLPPSMYLVADALAEGGAPGTAAGCLFLQPALFQESFYLSPTFIQQTEGHLPPGCRAWEELVIHTRLLSESVCGASSQPCQPRHSLPPAVVECPATLPWSVTCSFQAPPLSPSALSASHTP